MIPVQTADGRTFPPNSRWKDILSSLNVDDEVVNFGAGSPELSMLCALRGAKVDMVDTRSDLDTLYEQRYQDLMKAYQLYVKSAFDSFLSIGRIKEKFGGIRRIQMDCTLFAQKVEDNKYRSVVCENLIHFFTDEQQAVLASHVNRVLKPDGQCVVVDCIEHTDAENTSTFLVARPVLLYNGQPTPCQPTSHLPVNSGNNVPFYKLYRVEADGTIKGGTPPLPKFLGEQKANLIATAKEKIKEWNADKEDLIRIEVDFRRYYTINSIKNSAFALALSPSACYQPCELSGYTQQNKVVGYFEDEDGEHNKLEKREKQKVSVVFDKTGGI